MKVFMPKGYGEQDPEMPHECDGATSLTFSIIAALLQDGGEFRGSFWTNQNGGGFYWARVFHPAVGGIAFRTRYPCWPFSLHF